MTTPVLSSCVRLASAALLGLGAACNAIAGVEEGQLDPGTIDAELCSNSCEYARDGECDDGGLHSDYQECPIGSDCADCGRRTVRAPDTDIGRGCISSADCRDIPEGFCNVFEICTRPCTSHQDCGCAAGTGDDDILAGRCTAACAGFEDGHFCVRLCGADAHCDPPTTCLLAPGSGVCLPPE